VRQAVVEYNNGCAVAEYNNGCAVGGQSMIDEHRKLLEDNGWTVECESPLEIRHEDGSFATLNGADMVLCQLLFDQQDGLPRIKRQIAKEIYVGLMVNNELAANDDKRTEVAQEAMMAAEAFMFVAYPEYQS
jgi:hypothetical protein